MYMYIKDLTKLPTLMNSLLDGESDEIALLANASALIFDSVPNINWAGFYFVKGDELVLGPFQGKPACVRLRRGKGVCWAAVLKGETVTVRDVHEFEGHIACDSASRSEIVVPLKKGGEIFAVLDIDSPLVNRFEEIEDVVEKTAEEIESALNK